MATARPFDYGSKDYIERLNDLAAGFMPATDPITVDTEVSLDDNGSIIAFGAAAEVTFNADAMRNGFGVMIVADSGGTVTITAPFVGGDTSKEVTVGNAALVVCNGTAFRIFRMIAD